MLLQSVPQKMRIVPKGLILSGGLLLFFRRKIYSHDA